jgi:hypothetical protein
MMEEMEGIADNVPFVRISIPSAHPSVKTVISEIGFHWPVNTRLLVIRLTLRNSSHPNATIEGGKSNISLRLPQARWLGLEFVPSSGILEIKEMAHDQNHHVESCQKMELEEEDQQEGIDLDVDEDEDEAQDRETNDDTRYPTEERDYEDRPSRK